MKNIFLLVLCLCVSIAIQAQEVSEKSSGFISAIEVRSLFRSTNGNSEMKGIETEITAGYSFNRRFSLSIPLTETVGLFKKDDVKNYETTTQLGLRIGYSPVHSANTQFEIALKTGSTLGGTWQYMYYDLGLYYGSGYAHRRGAYIGAGVRYYQGYRGGLGNYCSLYITVGFRLNSYKGSKTTADIF